MTIGDVNNKISFYTNTSTNEYTAAQRLIDINDWWHKISTMIWQSQDDWDFDDLNNLDYPVATTPLVASQRDYTFPTSLNVSRVKRIDITYDGVTYYRAQPLDISEIPEGIGPASNSTMETNIDGRFSKTNPFYDLKSNSIWIYPRASTADVTAGGTILLQIARNVTEFTSADVSTGTKVPGFDPQFHPMLALGPSLEWAIAKSAGNKNDLAAELQDYEARLRAHYGRKNEDRLYYLKGVRTNYT